MNAKPTDKAVVAMIGRTVLVDSLLFHAGGDKDHGVVMNGLFRVKIETVIGQGKCGRWIFSGQLLGEEDNARIKVKGAVNPLVYVNTNDMKL